MPANRKNLQTSSVEQSIRDHAWIHFKQMEDVRQSKVAPMVLVRGKDSTVWDADDREYLDLLGGLYSVNAGYGRKHIVDEMAAQAEALPFANPFSYASLPAARLATRLSELAPLEGDARVFFTSGGSESVESALKLAKQYQLIRGFPNRWKTISRRGAYHGTTMGALSVNGLSGIREDFGPLVPGAAHVPMSNRYRCPYCASEPSCNLMCYDEIERSVAFERPERVAAIIMEPVQNAGGCIPPGSMEYFRKVRELCDQTGILMIMDEVICGFGRLGTLFGSTHFDVQPDIITTAKGITSSYAPLGAVLARQSVADTFGEGPGFLHGLTFGGHAVSCAAGNANLDIMLEEDLPGRAKETGKYLVSELHAAFDNHPIIGDIRGVGLFIGIELVLDRETRETLPIDSEHLTWITDELLRQGFIARTDDRGDPTTQLSPPLIITKDECDRTINVLVKVYNQLARKLGKLPTQHPTA